MCGILVSVGPRDASASHDDLVDWIAARGPDSLQTHRIQLPARDSETPLEITFTSSVLHLRGHEVTVQPLISGSGDVLCWNGEVWEGLEIGEEENDGVKLLAALTAGKPVWRVMEELEGPWAMVYYSSKDNKLWFGRDCLGRRSLLQKCLVESGVLMLSSVGVDMADWTEVGVEGLWCLDLNGWSMRGQNESASMVPWVLETSDEPVSHAHMLRRYPAMNRQLPKDTEEDISIPEQFLDILKSALSIRTRTMPQTHPHLHHSFQETTPRIAVLFSGGLDCSVLALLIHTLLPPTEPIDLINVAFENPRTVAAQKTVGDDVYNVCPDRITGRAGWEELKRLSQGTSRIWRFVEIDIPYQETLSKREEITKLMYPNDSVMDMSIAMAFYFAARGGGYEVHDNGSRATYTTPAKVFFSGLGADEQLGGYSRHAVAWKRSNGDWNAIIDELDHDLTRLPYRNLGRDDRIIANFGREVRYPFLDEGVIRFLSSLRADQKVSPGLTVSSGGYDFGDKRLLRRVAMMLGLERAAREKKRAVQFGSRSARMEEGVKLKGNDRLA